MKFRVRVILLTGVMAMLETLRPSTVQAKAVGNHFVGLTGGLAFPGTSSNIFTFGVNSMFRIKGNFGLGAFYQQYGIDASIETELGSASLDSSTYYYGLEPQYVLGGTLDGFTLGLRMGMVRSRHEASASDADDETIRVSDASSQFFFSPKIAFDYPVGRYSIGVDASYALGFGTGAPSAVILQLSTKFWF